MDLEGHSYPTIISFYQTITLPPQTLKGREDLLSSVLLNHAPGAQNGLQYKLVPDNQK